MHLRIANLKTLNLKFSLVWSKTQPSLFQGVFHYTYAYKKTSLCREAFCLFSLLCLEPDQCFTIPKLTSKIFCIIRLPTWRYLLASVQICIINIDVRLVSRWLIKWIRLCHSWIKFQPPFPLFWTFCCFCLLIMYLQYVYCKWFSVYSNSNK